MLPTTNTPWSAVSKLRREADEVSSVTAPAETDVAPQSRIEGPADPLRPIGPERLQALREAIRAGTYPTEADVLGGLQRMFRWEP